MNAGNDFIREDCVGADHHKVRAHQFALIALPKNPGCDRRDASKAHRRINRSEYFQSGGKPTQSVAIFFRPVIKASWIISVFGLRGPRDVSARPIFLSKY